jgi:hypothetical protein
MAKVSASFILTGTVREERLGVLSVFKIFLRASFDSFGQFRTIYNDIAIDSR